MTKKRPFRKRCLRTLTCGLSFKMSGKAVFQEGGGGKVNLGGSV